MKNDLKILSKDTEKPVIQNAEQEKPKQCNSSTPKNKRPTAKAYFKEMTSSKESLVTFIQDHLAPAVAGRTLHNVGGAYYGAIAKNTREIATDIVHNASCNYQAFKKKLETYSISSEELSTILKVDVNYKPSKKVKTTPVSKKEKALNTLRNKLDGYITDTEKLELLVQNIYTELKPIMDKTK